MNILAHLHLATLANSSIIGNAAADFVRGNPHLQYDKPIADGIMMHRRLDKLIDDLPDVKQARLLFRPETRRVAPITLDIIWDHFLSKHWHRYVEQDLDDFSSAMQVIITKDAALFSLGFGQFMAHLWQRNSLINYGYTPFIEEVLNGMANRRPRLDLLRDTYVDFIRSYAELERIFFTLYPFLMEKALSTKL